MENDFTIKYFPFLIILHPKANNKNIKFNEVLQKSWSYSLGRGALIRKHNHLNLYFKLKNLIVMPILKFFYGFFRLNSKDAVSGLVSLASRITGFIQYDK